MLNQVILQKYDIVFSRLGAEIWRLQYLQFSFCNVATTLGLKWAEHSVPIVMLYHLLVIKWSKCSIPITMLYHLLIFSGPSVVFPCLCCIVSWSSVGRLQCSHVYVVSSIDFQWAELWICTWLSGLFFSFLCSHGVLFLGCIGLMFVIFNILFI